MHILVYSCKFIFYWGLLLYHSHDNNATVYVHVYVIMCACTYV